MGTAPDTTVYEFFQDAAGRLAQMKKNGANYRYFLWNGDDLYAELDSAGVTITEYSWYPGMDRLHQYKDSIHSYNPTTDALGNVVALTSSTGVWRTYDYRIWGDSTGGADSRPFSPEVQRKSGIALHYNVCDNARTTIGLWRRDKATVATAFRH